MRRRWLIVGVALLALVAIPVAVLFEFGTLLEHALTDDLCGECLVDQVISPDRRYTAVVFRRDCGATTSGRTRHVNLRESTRPFPANRSGTITDGQVFITDAEGAIELIWKGPKHLVIRAKLSDPAAEQTAWRDVAISYDPLPITIIDGHTGAVLRRLPRLWGSDLHGLELVGADFSRENLSRANLQRANLRSANLKSAYLVSADLRGANLAGADLECAMLNDVDLRGACLRGANLSGAFLQNARLQHTDLRRATFLDGTNLEGTDLTGANLAGSTYSSRKPPDGEWLGTVWPDGFDPRQHGAILARPSTATPP